MGKLKDKAGVLGQAGWKTYGVKAVKDHVAAEASVYHRLSAWGKLFPVPKSSDGFKFESLDTMH